MAIIVAPNGAVSAVAPHDASLDKIHERLQKRARWILCQQRFFEQFRPLTPPRRYVSGETHLYLGKQYRLKITIGETPSVKLKRRLFCHCLHCTPSGGGYFARMVSKAGVKNLYSTALTLFGAFPAVEKPPALRIQQMKSRWASLSQRNRLTITPTLIKAPKICIEYVLMHELCHISHRHHNAAFYRLLNAKFPIGKQENFYWKNDWHDGISCFIFSYTLECLRKV